MKLLTQRVLIREVAQRWNAQYAGYTEYSVDICLPCLRKAVKLAAPPRQSPPCHPRTERGMESVSTLDERIAKANAELDARNGPGPFDCRFCGVDTKQPCVLANCMECQNFGYYPKRAATPSRTDGGGQP